MEKSKAMEGDKKDNGRTGDFGNSFEFQASKVEQHFTRVLISYSHQGTIESTISHFHPVILTT